MAAEDRILRALLRIEADKGAINATVREVERVEDAVEDLGDTADGLSLGQRIQQGMGRIQTGVGAGLGRLPGMDPLGGLTDTAKDRLEFLGDGFDQLITTLDELGVELDGTAEAALKAATSLARISTDPIGAAVNAVGQVVVAWQDFNDKMVEGQKQVDDAWSDLLDDGFESASELAEEYSAAQQRVSQAHERGGIIADLLVDKSKVLNANMGMLQGTLMDSASNYEDYARAVKRINENLPEGAKQVDLLTRAEFDNRRELERVRAEVERGTASLADLADAYQRSGNFAAMLTTRIGVMAEAAAEAVDEIQKLNQVWPDAVGAFANYQDEIARLTDERALALADLEKDLGNDRVAAGERLAERREGIQEVFNDQMAALEKMGTEQRRNLMENFIQQSNAAEAAYYSRRAQMAAQFGIQAMRAEEDHQRRIQRMKEDAELREQDLIGARDALGLARARRDAERDRRRADEDFARQQGRRAEDFARQMEQARIEFERQQAQRQADYERQLAALEEGQTKQADLQQEAYDDQQQAATDAYTKEMGGLKTNFDERGAEINTQYDREEEMTRAAFAGKLADLGANLLGERALRQQYYDVMSDDLRRWLEDNAAAFRGLLPQPPPGLQAGGYAGPGLFQLGERGREFVLSNPTTKAAERLAGSPLTQAGVLAALGGRGGAITLAPSFTFNGRLTGEEQQAAKGWVYEVLDEISQRLR